MSREQLIFNKLNTNDEAMLVIILNIKTAPAGGYAKHIELVSGLRVPPFEPVSSLWCAGKGALGQIINGNF